MPTPLPQEPSGDHPLVETVKRIIRCLREREIIADRDTISVKKTAQGTVIAAKPQTGGGGGSSGFVPRWG